ncbi:MAG: hypothetical protein D6706_18570 [Chloroflexi bacterium]|nr:MAG: hypothetical protein D6706_18570 [Chloroflexota bacterium]
MRRKIGRIARRQGVPPRAIKRAVRRRVRPAVRAERRRAAMAGRPLPPPPSRRHLAHAHHAGVDESLQARISDVQSTFTRLEAEAQLGGIYESIGRIDTQLTELPLVLETLHTRGFVHSGPLEDRLEQIDDKWDDVRARVEETLRHHVQTLDVELDKTERLVTRLGVAGGRVSEGAVSAVETAVNALANRIQAAETAVTALYRSIAQELNAIEHEIHQIEKIVTYFEESAEIQLYDTEAPLQAVESVWQQNGEDGPEGILFLTDQRLLFEQRDEIVTEKLLGIFKTKSEKVQRLLLDVAAQDIETVTHKKEGGFLGMGKDDILEFVFTATAPVSRARFHLKGADSATWAALIKRIQTGEIDEDRADEYVEEVETARKTAASFPAQCPNCFAAVPPPPRGVTAVTCEYCGSTIKPQAS